MSGADDRPNHWPRLVVGWLKISRSRFNPVKVLKAILSADLVGPYFFSFILEVTSDRLVFLITTPKTHKEDMMNSEDKAAYFQGRLEAIMGREPGLTEARAVTATRLVIAKEERREPEYQAWLESKLGQNKAKGEDAGGN